MLFFLAFKQVDKSGKGLNSNGQFVTRAIIIGEGFGGSGERLWFREIDVLSERNFFIYEL